MRSSWRGRVANTTSSVRLATGILSALLAACAPGCQTGSPEADKPVSIEEIWTEADGAVQAGAYERADGLLEQGLAAAQAEGAVDWVWKFRLLRSERLIRDGQFQSALEVLRDPVPESVRPSSLRGRVALNRARACLQLSLDAEAEAWLEKAERWAGDDDPGLPIDILNRKAQLKTAQGDLEAARQLFERSVSGAVDSGVPRLIVEAAGNLGWFLEEVVRRPDRAIPYYESSLEAALDSGDRISIVRVKTNLGWCYNKLGDFERALELIKSAVPMALEVGGPDLDNTLAVIGAVYQLQGDYENALDYYRRSLEVATDPRSRASLFYNMANCHIELGDWDLARSFNEKAIANRGPDDPEGLAYPQVASAEILIGEGRLNEAEAVLRDVAKRAVSFQDPVPLWEAYANLGRLSAEKGNLGEADRMYQLALEKIEAERRELRRVEWKISFHSLWNHFARSYVDLLVDRGESDRALERSEANRALVLSERLGVTPARGRSSSAGFIEAAKRLDATLLTYWLAPKKSFLWAVTKNEIRRIDLPPAAEIEAMIEGHRNRLMASQVVPEGDPYAVGLYQTLVAPVADLLKPGGRVIVVPDGRLHELNFETLQTPGADSRFLIQDHTLAVAPSLRLLEVETARPKAPKSLLLVGDPIAVDDLFPALPGAKTEIAAILRSFEPDRTTAILRERATPEAYRDASPENYALLHFTAHAIANTINPLNSAVILSPRPDGAFRLLARDVEETRLHAMVVTLSACRSAGAKAYSGEGLVGFAWAFLQAGAENVVAGLWDVDDQATAKLMGFFYQRLASGAGPAAALRDAKLQMLKQGYGNPYYWAPFQIYTRSSPFEAPPKSLVFRRSGL